MVSELLGARVPSLGLTMNRLAVDTLNCIGGGVYLVEKGFVGSVGDSEVGGQVLVGFVGEEDGFG